MLKRLGFPAYARIKNDKWIKRFSIEGKLKQNNKQFAMFDKANDIASQHLEALITPLWRSITWWNLTMSMKTNWRRITSLTKIYIRKYVKISKKVSTLVYYKYRDYMNLMRRMIKYNRYACKLITCLAGFEPKKEEFTTEVYAKRFAWHCNTCPKDYVKPNNGSDPCMKCKGVTVSNKKQTECYDPYRDIVLDFSQGEGIGLLVCLIFSLIINIIAIVVFVKYHSTPLIRSSGFVPSLFQLLMHLLVSIVIFVVFMNMLNLAKCISQVAVSGALLVLISSVTFAKTQKLLFVFNGQMRLSKTEVIMSKTTEIVITIVLLVIQVAICVISIQMDPPKVDVTLTKEHIIRRTRCINEGHMHAQFVYILILSCLCGIQSFRARRLPKHYTETKEIAFSMFITIMIIVVRFPLIASRDKNEHSFMDALFIILINTSQLSIMYTQTLYNVIFHPEKNTKHYFDHIRMEESQKDADKKMAKRNRRKGFTNSVDNEAYEISL